MEADQTPACPTSLEYVYDFLRQYQPSMRPSHPVQLKLVYPAILLPRSLRWLQGTWQKLTPVASQRQYTRGVDGVITMSSPRPFAWMSRQGELVIHIEDKDLLQIATYSGLAKLHLQQRKLLQLHLAAIIASDLSAKQEAWRDIKAFEDMQLSMACS